MKKLKEKYPVWLSIFAIALFWILDIAIGFLLVLLPENICTNILTEIIFMIIPFLLVLLFSDVRVYRDKGMAKTLSAGAYMFVSQAVLVWSMLQLTLLGENGSWADPWHIIYGIIALFGIGFREESLFRGIVVKNIGDKYIKNRKGIFFTVFVSGVIFGGIHLTNLFVGVDALSATVQSIVAMGAGFYLGAVYLRGGSLWAVIIMHILTDAASLFLPTFTTDGGTVVETINDIGTANLTPFFIMSAITLFLLRKSKCDEILERFNKEDASL